MTKKEKENYKLITDEELEAPTMPDSEYKGQDEKYIYFKCGTQKVKVVK